MSNRETNNYKTIIAQYAQEVKAVRNVFGLVKEQEKHFPEKSYAKCSGEASPTFFSKKTKFSKSLDQQSKVLNSLFSLYLKVAKYHMLKLRCRLLLFTSCKTF